MKKLLLILISITLLQAVPSVTAYFQDTQTVTYSVTVPGIFESQILFLPGTATQYNSTTLASSKPDGSTTVNVNFGTIPGDASIKERKLCISCLDVGYYDEALSFTNTFSVKNNSSTPITIIFSTDSKFVISGKSTIPGGSTEPYSISFKVGTKSGTSLGLIGLLGIDLFSSKSIETQGQKNFTLTTSVTVNGIPYVSTIPMTYTVP